MVKLTPGRILFYLLNFLIGLLFLFGAYAKLQDIEPFEWSLAETGLIGFGMANILARVFICLEFFVGLLFVGSILLGNTIYALAAWLLFVFNIYLLWIIGTYGNNGNCGCFGNALQILPMEAYIKNLVLLLFVYILSRYSLKFGNAAAKWQVYVLGLLPLLYTFTMQPPDFIFIKENDKVKPSALNLDELYGANASSKPNFNYKEGKHIISILSTSCIFCKKAARKIHSIQSRNSQLPFYNVILGDSISLIKFYAETASKTIPHQLNDNVPYFFKLANNRLPCILWIENGNVVRISNYFNLQQTDIENWIKN